MTLVFFASCGEKQEAVEQSSTENNSIVITEEQWKAQEYQLVSPTNQLFSDDISATGVIDIPPKNKAVISVKMEGYVKNISLLEGDYVRKGQLLFQMENPKFLEIQQSFLELHEQLTYLESEYTRYKKMREENVVAEKVFLKAQSDYKTAKARHDGLKEQLILLNLSVTQLEKGNFTSVVNVYAPLAGYVANLKIAKGMFVEASFNALEILGNDHLHAELYVYENDVLKLQKGQEVILSPQSSLVQKIKGEIHLIGKSLDENRRVKVHVHFSDSIKNLIVGMSVQGNIMSNQYEGKGLPSTALVEVNNQYYTLQFKEKANGKYLFEKRLVNTGSTHNNFIELKDEVDENAQFLKDGAFYLLGE